MKKDTMQIEIMPDGSLKVSIDPVSAPNHTSAERMLLAMFQAIGADRADIETKHRHGKKYHSHDAGHGHNHHANQ